MDHRIFVCTVWGIALMAVSCATPSQPTGGPPDEEGPTIIKTEPETGTTNFSDQGITLHFSEFIERASLNEAMIIEPDIGIGYELDWGRKSVEIAFGRAIPDSTTLILSVGTELSDTRGNEMSTPQKIAVSTGTEIDKGKLLGRIVDAQTGSGDEGQRVLLYREPIDLKSKADYIASTDTSGVFQFSYLSEGTYKALWVDDRNRNKIWESKQERAQPFSKEFVQLAKAEADTLPPLFVIAEDTTKPVLQGVGLFSSQRLRMRFSENISLTDSTAITITDTTGNELMPANPLYVPPGEAFVLFSQSDEALAESETYSLNIQGLIDESGNELTDISQHFTGSSQEDTTTQRIITRNNLSGYYPTDSVQVTYAKPIDESTITDSLKIVEGTELVESWPAVNTRANILQIAPDPMWKDGLVYEFRIWYPIIEDYRKLNPTIWHDSQMGKLKVMVQDSSRKNIQLQIGNEKSGIARDTVFAKQVEIASLPPINYTIIAFQDVNKNGKWDFGQVTPFIEPEPYFIQSEVPVERGLTGDLRIQFQQ